VLLQGLATNPGILSPAFSPAVFVYAITTAWDYVNITTSANAIAQTLIDGSPVTTDSISLPFGLTSVQVTQKAKAFGCTVAQYSIDVLRGDTLQLE
jgi:hypothetical protein